MMRHVKLISIAACLLVASLANSQVEYAWKVIATHPSAQSITAYQGETIDLKPALYSYNNLVTNITSATLYWQTNGMATAWWSKPAEINDGQITAIFAPTNDFGAAAYTFFLRASGSGGASYRANGTLRMLDSPGHSPAVAVAPSAYGTLAQDIAPWVLAVLPEYEAAGAALAVSNTLAGVIGEHSEALAVVAEALQNTSNSLAQVDAVKSMVETNTAAIDALKSVAITNEMDKAAMRAWHYGSSDIVETDAAAFGFDAESGIITNYNFAVGGADVVIPWQIGGVRVKGLGELAFVEDADSGIGQPIVRVISPRSLTDIGSRCFALCDELVEIDSKDFKYVGDGAFFMCSRVSEMVFGAVTNFGWGAFDEMQGLTNLIFECDYVSGLLGSAFGEGNQGSGFKITVTNPSAAGWPEYLTDGVIYDYNVRRPALRADALYVGGEEVALKSDMPDTLGLVANMHGTATDLSLLGTATLNGKDLATVPEDGWNEVTASGGAVVVSNNNEQAAHISGSGDVSVAFEGLRQARPLYVAMEGFGSVTWPAGTYFVGGGVWQTNAVNVFVVWLHGTNLVVNPVTAFFD